MSATDRDAYHLASRQQRSTSLMCARLGTSCRSQGHKSRPSSGHLRSPHVPDMRAVLPIGDHEGDVCFRISLCVNELTVSERCSCLSNCCPSRLLPDKNISDTRPICRPVQLANLLMLRLNFFLSVGPLYLGCGPQYILNYSPRKQHGCHQVPKTAQVDRCKSAADVQSAHGQ